VADINKSGYKVTRSGSVRHAGQLAEGDASTGRGSTAREGTLASSNKGGSGEGGVHFRQPFASGTKQKFRPTTKGGKVTG
jgi:hypothetical protein